MIDLEKIVGFDWDGNSRKSADKHDVSQAEAESIFFNDTLIDEDSWHSKGEQRFNALGTTTRGACASRYLYAEGKWNTDPRDIGTRHESKGATSP